MNTKLKKILIIIVIILIIALAGLLIYNFLIKKDAQLDDNNGNLPGEQPNSNNDQNQNQGNIEQPISERKIIAISMDPVLSPTTTNNKTSVIYYSKINGNIIQSDFDGLNKITVSDTNLDNLIKVIWSPDKNKTLTTFQDNLENVSKYHYNLSDKKSSPLNQNIDYISWSSDSSKIAYQYQNATTDENTINTSNPDGSRYSAIFKTRMKDLIVEWPKGSTIYLREKPSGLAKSNLYSLNSLSKAFNKVISDIYGFSLKWSVAGDKILYSKTGSKGENIALFIASANGSGEKAMNVQTLVEKCTWSQDTRYIFCAIPNNIKDAKVLPDDFYKGTFVGDDGFYKINTETGEKINLLESEGLNEFYDANELFLSSNEDYLFFVNKNNGLLYRIKI
ncbi:MAG: hypothetical protein V1686_01850 [Patescibacteria group bacterium]